MLVGMLAGPASAAPGDHGKACERGFENALVANPGDAEGWENMDEDAQMRLWANYVDACVA